MLYADDYTHIITNILCIDELIVVMTTMTTKSEFIYSRCSTFFQISLIVTLCSYMEGIHEVITSFNAILLELLWIEYDS